MAAAPDVETLHPRCSCCCTQYAWLVRLPPRTCRPPAPHPPAHTPNFATTPTPRRAQDAGGGGGQPGAGVGLVGLCSTVRGLVRYVGGARGRAAHLGQGCRVRFNFYVDILRIISPAAVQNKLQVRWRAAIAASPAQRRLKCGHAAAPRSPAVAATPSPPALSCCPRLLQLRAMVGGAHLLG